MTINHASAPLEDIIRFVASNLEIEGSGGSGNWITVRVEKPRGCPKRLCVHVIIRILAEKLRGRNSAVGRNPIEYLKKRIVAVARAGANVHVIEDTRRLGNQNSRIRPRPIRWIITIMEPIDIDGGNGTFVGTPTKRSTCVDLLIHRDLCRA